MLKQVRTMNTKGLSLVLIAVFMASSLTATLPLVSAQLGSAPSTYNVSWHKESPKESNNWTWTNIEWIYGPSIALNVTYANGTTLINPSGGLPSHYLYPGYQFRVNMTVPKSLVELGRNVSQISFNMNKFQSYFNGTQSVSLWSASIYLSYTAYPMSYGGSVGYRPVDPWTFESQFWNYSKTGSGGGTSVPTYPSTGPYVAPPTIFIPNRAACRFVETEDYYSVQFQGQLNATLQASGTYYYNYYVSDTKGSSINTRGQYGGSIIVIEPDITYGPGYMPGCLTYGAYTKDMENKYTQIVTPGTKFKIVVEVSGNKTNVGNVSIILPPPVDCNWWADILKNPQLLSSWKYVNTSEGWFNTWNDTAYEWQTGSHLAYGERKILLTCNVDQKTFHIDEGFQYWIYNTPDYMNQSTRFDYNQTDSSNFYSLYSIDDVTRLTNGFRVEFILDIKREAKASAGEYWFDTKVTDIDGCEMCRWTSPSFNILGANVVKMELLKENKNEPLLRITPGKYFRAVMEISSSQSFRETLLGHTTNITFRFDSASNCRSWTIGDTDYWDSSYLTFYVTRNTISNAILVEVINHTSSSWYNKLTYESDYAYGQEKVDWTKYVSLATEDFTEAYDPSNNILTLAFNFTFMKNIVPEGCYSWEGYIANKTWPDAYEWYKWSSNESLDYSDLRVPDTWNILVGTGESYWYYWSAPQAWSVDTVTGALDLDGNNMTTYDQFYVKRVYNSTSYWSQSGDRMTVNLNWGSYNMWSYFALMNCSWRYEWNELYLWYYPGNKSKVPNNVFVSQINITIWDTEDNAARAEYCQISYLTVNRTWDRIRSEYSAYPWWNEYYNWYWLEINFDQNFWTPSQYGGSSNNLFFQYAGLLLFNDTNDDGVLNMGFAGGSAEARELTHYFMFENAKGIELTTPFTGNNGSVQVSVDDGVSWGVSVQGLNGTTYPTQVAGYSGFAGLGWWWHDCYGTYTHEGNFSTVPSEVGISNLDFTAHFSIPNANLTAGAVNEVRVKIDEGAGVWTLYSQPQSQLLNYSMAIAFLASSSSWQYSFKTFNGTDVQSDGDSAMSDVYNVTTQGGTKLANIQMGGAYYTWGKDGHNYIMHSSTTPMSAFSAMYSSYSMSGSGDRSISTFSMTGSNYYMTSSFKNWDGFNVYTDPYFAVYTAQQSPGGGFLGGAFTVLLIGVAALVLVIAVVVIRKRRQGGIESTKPTESMQPTQ